MNEREHLDLLFLKRLAAATELQAIKDYCFLRKRHIKRNVPDRGSVTEIRIFFHNIEKTHHLEKVDELLDQEEKDKKKRIKNRGRY